MEMTAEKVLERALRYRDYWGAEGGITLSGGEPMLQPEFAAELFELAKARGITTCLDTSAGQFSRERAEIVRLLDCTDTVLLDIKAFDDALHRRLTGSGNAQVLDCARYLAEKGRRMWIRRVLVPGLTDGEDDLRATGDFIRSLAAVEKVEVLPYHSMGEAKWKALGLDYRLAGVDAPGQAAVERARSLLQGLPFLGH
jgi:pyruvate formate lyase activating enzyme